MKEKIVIVDYGYGNIFSLKSALRILGFDTLTTNDPKKIAKSKIIILPGVGSFKQAIGSLNNLGITEAVKIAVNKGSGIIGICLGYQMLFEVSEELGIHKGLGFIEGKVKKLKPNKKYSDRVPNVGWRPIKLNKKNKCLSQSFNDAMLYFVHSYVPHVKNNDIVSTYVKFADTNLHSSIYFKNIAGFQFHPEKSGKIGLMLLKETILSINGKIKNFNF